ncbi:hypothetical protein ACVIW2_000034 [Bradyrhizobium huanghuaihaiense]
MIEVVVSENDRVIDRLRFDADTLVSNNVATMHRGVMRELSRSDDLWQRVAHAAGYLAGARAFKNASRRLESFALAQRLRTVPSLGRIVRTTQPKPQIEIEDDDLYRLQRDENERQAEYRARCEMLGCNHDGFARLPRRT